MMRLQVSSLRSPPAYIERAGMAPPYWRLGHQAIAHGYDPSPTVLDIAVMCVLSIICVASDRPRAASSRNSRSQMPRSAQRTNRL